MYKRQPDTTVAAGVPPGARLSVEGVAEGGVYGETRPLKHMHGAWMVPDSESACVCAGGYVLVLAEAEAGSNLALTQNTSLASYAAPQCSAATVQRQEIILKQTGTVSTVVCAGSGLSSAQTSRTFQVKRAATGISPALPHCFTRY